MEQPIEIEATLEGRLFNTVGSFWTSVFQDRAQARLLVSGGLRDRVLGEFNRAVQELAGDRELRSLVRHVEVPFRASDIITTGMQVYDQPSPQRDFGAWPEAATVYDEDRIRYWALPLTNILPLSIQSRSGQLLAGVDFFIQAGRYVYFRQDPQTLFNGGYYLVTRGHLMQPVATLAFFTGTPPNEHDDLVVDWLRGPRTPGQLRLALATVGGLGVVRRGGILRAVIPSDDGTDRLQYAFDGEVVTVTYPHDQLTVGTAVPAGTIIGDVIQVEQADRETTAWWRKIDWRGGILLDPLIPETRFLPLPDAWTLAYATTSDNGSVEGSRVHTRLRLGADFYRESVFWEKIALRESWSDRYLNSVVGLQEPAAGSFDALLTNMEEANRLNALLGLPVESPDVAALSETKQVNALDVFFQAVLGQVGMALVFDQGRIPNQKAMLDFLRQHAPLGGCPIIVGTVPTIVSDQDSFGGTISDGTSVTMSEGVLIQVVEDVDVSWFEHETVTITPHYPLP